MIEQKIEEVILTKLQNELTAASVAGVQLIGAWQSAAEGDVKAAEDDSKRGYLTVKVSPRRHDTFTVAEASFDVSVSLTVRAESDERGLGFVSITEACASEIYKWQRSFSDFESAFAIENEFSPTGFRLDGGDCGIDRANALWSWLQNFTVQGIVLT